MIPQVGPGMIGLPCADNLRTADILSSLWALKRPAGTVFKKASGLGPAKPLNEIGRAFLANPDLQWLFLTNDDNTLPPDALMKLLTRNVDVVSGLYVGKVIPFQPVAMLQLFREPAYRRATFSSNAFIGMQKVDAVGDGCLLIRRPVMARVQQPWWDYDGEECNHDVRFCQAVRELGYTVWLDTDVRVGHTSTFNTVPHINESGEWEIHLQQGGDGRTIVLPAAVMQK